MRGESFTILGPAERNGHEEIEGLSVTTFKLIAMVAVIAISLVGSLLPLRLHSLSEKQRSRLTVTTKYLTAGVFLGVGLLHMLPEAAESLQAAGLGQLPGDREFPLAYGVAALGFVLVWYLERYGRALWGHDRERVLAVAAQAEKRGGGSICYVQVETVASYGPVVCTPAGLLSTTQGVPAGGTVPSIPAVQVVRSPGRGGGAQDGYVALANEFGGKDSLSAAVHGELRVDSATAKQQQLGGTVDAPSSRPGQRRHLIRELYQHVQYLGGGGSPRASSTASPLVGDAVASEGATAHAGERPPDPPLSPQEGTEHSAEGRGEEPHCNSPRSREGAAVCPAAGVEAFPPAAEKGGPPARIAPLPRLPSGPDHSHDWGQFSGVEGGSSFDRCAALHQHTHGAQHRHIVLQGRGGMSYLLAGLFSIHSFVVGAALGISHSLDSALPLLIALVAHKGAEAFSVGVQFVREEVPVGKTVAIMLLYCAMTPLGIATGMAAMLMQGPTGIAVANLVQAFGAGTVLYIVMHQLNEEGSSQAPTSQGRGLVELLLFLAGLSIMAAVSVFT